MGTTAVVVLFAVVLLVLVLPMLWAGPLPLFVERHDGLVWRRYLKRTYTTESAAMRALHLRCPEPGTYRFGKRVVVVDREPAGVAT